MGMEHCSISLVVISLHKLNEAVTICGTTLSLYVLQQTPLLREASSSRLAGEWLLSRVDFVMLHSVPLLVKLFVSFVELANVDFILPICFRIDVAAHAYHFVLY
jgi:hypothetical protein